MSQAGDDLADQARVYAARLAHHPVLRTYWDRVSLVLMGSAARGDTDRYSDVDLVFFCTDDVRRQIVAAYRRLGLTERADGIFVPLDNWAGHYHVESWQQLRGYFREQNNPRIWELRHALPLHDPRGRFVRLMDVLSQEPPGPPLAAVKRAYLDLRLTLGWMRLPLQRGDAVAATLYCATLLRDSCRISYLLDGLPYPNDKWVAFYLDTTRFGTANRARIVSYVDGFPRSGELLPDLELDRYPSYAAGLALIERVASFIREHHGSPPWIDDWTAYV